MKKQNNILKFTQRAVCLFFATLFCYACVEEDLLKSGKIVEGVPIEVSLGITAPEMEQVSTRMNSDDESRVSDLYVFIFNASDHSKKEGSRYYPGEELNATKTITLKTTSGESLIYAVANITGTDLSNENGSILKAKLDKVNNLDDLKQITTSLNEPGNIQRSGASLMMSGSFISQSTNTNTTEGYCIIPALKNATLAGKIALKRLDSQITFKLEPVMEGDQITVDNQTINGKIVSFTPVEWKVYNVPVKSYVLGQDKDAISATESDYNESASSIQFETDDANRNNRFFSFYMLENRKNAKTYNGTQIANYQQRELEIKENNLNTGDYKFVEKYATYVEFMVKMEIKNSSTDDGIRVANVKYTVHLGYIDNKADDFKSLRNKRYTYHIKIIDVENIIAEVTDETHPENQPGAEGDIVDAKTKVFKIDSHYAYLNLAFSYTDVENGLHFIIKTPFATTENTSIDKTKCDYSWIRFMKNGNNHQNENSIEKYDQQNNMLNIFELENNIKEQYEKDKDKTKLYYYTAYVDEYYYDSAPAGLNWGNDAGIFWTKFVNREDRYILLIFSPKESPDKESSYAGAKYMISQRSIQTYYSTTNLNEPRTALGMEHENETGKPDSGSDAQYGNSSFDGYTNTSNEWGKVLSTDYALDNTYAELNELGPSGKTYNMKVKDAMYQCMSRNRDENGDGKINGAELKWYLPATQQLVGMYLGAESLPSPLFSKNDPQPTGTDTHRDGTYHYYTSNNQRIWAEEGATFGSVNVSYATLPEQLRCVRTLGSVNATSSSQEAGKIYNYIPANKTFEISYMNPKNIRTSYVANNELGTHNHMDETNRPYKAFQMAKDRMSLDRNNNPQIGLSEISNFWENFVSILELNYKSICTKYFENTDKSDMGSWRAPNQRELLIMYMQNSDFVNNGAYSKTAWKFNETYHFGTSGANVYMDRKNKGGSSVRCVRDIQSQ